MHTSINPIVCAMHAMGMQLEWKYSGDNQFLERPPVLDNASSPMHFLMRAYLK